MTKSLMIDAGHGGTDPGANGFGIKEKDWTLKMSLYQYRRLKELGANVHITRLTDKTIESNTRGKLIASKYTYCMSNHFNAFNGNARGVETIHSIHSKPTVAKKLAGAITLSSGLPLRRVFTRRGNGNTDYYFMHRLTGSTQTVIVEYGFIDNVKDNTFYKNENNFNRVAEAVVKVWCELLGITYKPVSKPPATPTGKLYKVQVGAYASKANAEKQLKALEQKGFKGFVKYE